MKKERVYREILYDVLEERTRVFKQLELSRVCKMSLRIVNLHNIRHQLKMD